MKQLQIKQVLWVGLILLIAVTPMISHAEIVKSKTIDNGGSGPYKAIAASEMTLPNYVIYRPEDIGDSVQKEGKLPILVFANGGCSDTSITHERVLSEIASHGYIVIAIGALQMTPGQRQSSQTEATMLTDAIDWMSVQCANENSEYYEKVDLSKIASGGQSCGGAQILAVASDPRIKTYMMFNSGMGQMSMAGATPESLKELHGPIVYIVGGTSDIAYSNALIDYDNLDKNPVAFANLEKGGHMGTFGQRFGGSFARIALEWLNWQLKGRDKTSAVFLKADLEKFPDWTMKAKNFGDESAEKVVDSEPKEITITQDISYREGDSNAWKLDMAMPSDIGDALRPALVIVHGGGWSGGSKSVDVYQKMMLDYAHKGYVTINVEYRLTREAPFPACIEDVKCAVRWLRAHAQEYRVDPNRIGAYGHSAGAHLALMLAMAPESAGLEGDGGWNEYSSRVNVAAAGSPPTELGRDTPMSKKEWWPIGYISADHPPLFLIQGGDDRIVRPELTEDFLQKMKTVGANIEYLRIDGVGHGVAYAERLEVTDPAIEKFFAKYLKSDSGEAASKPASIESSVPTITVDATAPQRAVSPEMYGIFFEEINHAGDGGLYAEMTQNRDMEATNIPEGWRIEGNDVVTPQGWRTRVWFDSDLPGWTYLDKGDVEGSMELDDTQPLNDRNPHSLKLTVTKTGKPEDGDLCGIVNSGYWGMNVVKGDWYDVSFYARSDQDRSVGLVFSLENDEGKVCARSTIPEIGRGGWRQYKLSLHAYQSDPKCRLVITPIEPVTIWLDVISVFPRKTFKNRPNGMRVDVAQALADMKPGFLRFPGGCVVEGASLTNRFCWKDSIGDISQRRGNFNLWGYYSTYGLGFHEYLQFAEDLGAKSMYVCNVGMSCQARRSESCDDEDIDFYVQEALDAIEYAVGPVTSEWGAKRAENGHPEPFKLKYVEIGNENHGPDYIKRYEIFYKAIKEKYPNIITIADTTRDMGDSPIEIVDEHYYRSPDSFFSMSDYYDNTDRMGPKIYVGEYAVNRGVGTGNLIGGISEAVYMLNMEKNADMVIMCSYAPLLENVNERNWPVNLIWLDSSRVVGRSSYQIQKLFGIHRPDVVVQTTVEADKVSLESVPVRRRRRREGPSTDQTQGEQDLQYVQADQLYAQAGLDKGAGELILKVVNPTQKPVKAQIALKGLTDLGNTAKIISVGNSDATVDNSLEKPNVVMSVTSQMAVSGPEFATTFKPHSLTVLRLKVTSK